MADAKQRIQDAQYSVNRKRGEMAAKRRRRKNADAADGGIKSRRRANFVRGLLVVVVLLCCVLPVALLAHPISYVPLILVLLTIGISYAYVQVLAKSLRFDDGSLISACERGTKVPLTVTLRNSSMLPHPRIELNFYITDLFGGYDSIVPLVTALGPHESSDFSFDAQFAHLGRYSVGVDHVVVNDLIGLFSKTISGGSKHDVIVHPKTVDLAAVDISSVTVQESENLFKPLASDDMDYAGVRDYQYGDPLKTVHWNLSSRTADGSMFTRLFEVFTNPSMTIVVDSFCSDKLEYEVEELMSVFDGLVESAASVSNFAQEAGIECDLRFLDKDGNPQVAFLASMDDADQLVGAMKHIQPEQDDRVLASESLNILRRVVMNSAGSTNVVYCTSRLDPSVITTLVETAARRKNPVLFLALPRSLRDRQRAEFLAPLSRLAAAGVPCYLVESTEERTMVVTQ